MQTLFSRLNWRSLPLWAKVAALFGLQMVLLLLLGVMALAGQAVVRGQLETGVARAIEMRALAQDLQLDLQDLQRLEVSVAEQQIEWNTLDQLADRMTAQHASLVESIGEDAARIEELAGKTLDAADVVPFRVEVRTIQTSAENGERQFATMLDELSRLTAPGGPLARMESAGAALAADTGMTRSPELTMQLNALLATGEDLVARGDRADLERLQEEAPLFLALYEEQATGARDVPGVTALVSDYLAAAAAVTDATAAVQNAGRASEVSLDVAVDSASRLNTITEDQRLAQMGAVSQLQRSLNTTALIGIGVVLVLGALLGVLFGRDINRSVRDLLRVTRQMAAGDLSVRAPVPGEDEFSQLGHGFNTMADRLGELVGGLEQRVAERARDLSITAEIGQAVTARQDARDLLFEVVDLIRQRFGYYHVQVFIVDDAGEQARLVASTGTAGRELLARGHALAVGSQSVIGQVTGMGQPVVAADTIANPVHRRNELLPDTRAEMALPMRMGDRVIGALDVQSVSANAFDEDVVAVFQVMADQLAMALEHARLQTELEDAYHAVEAAERRVTAEAWDAYRRGRGVEDALAYELRDAAVLPHNSPPPHAVGEALRAGHSVMARNGGPAADLAVPIRVRGEVIGAFGFSGEALDHLSDDDLTLVEAVADRVGLALENMRLVEQTTRRAEHEQILNEITSKIVGSTNVEHILQTTVRELGRVLRTPQTSVQLRRNQMEERS